MKNIILILYSVVVFAVISFSVLSGLALNYNSDDMDAKTQPEQSVSSDLESSPEEDSLILPLKQEASGSETVTQPANILDEKESALSRRLSQLIQLNRVFDEYVGNDAALVEEASIILLQDAETDAHECKMLKQSILFSFIYDLYGREIDLSSLPGQYTEHVPEGYIYIPPRCYDLVEQTFIGLILEKDGRITVASTLHVYGLGDMNYISHVETVFVENPASAFGYSIVSARILSLSGMDDSAAPFALPELEEFSGGTEAL